MMKKKYKKRSIYSYLKFFIISFIFSLIILSSINVYAEPSLNFNEIQSYKLNYILLSNLSYDKKANIQVFAYTYENKKELIFLAKLDHYVKNFTCYFYCHPDFAKIELLLEFDSYEKYKYEYKVKINREAEKDFIKFNFNEKYFYEIIEPEAEKTYYKILNEYNPNFFSMMATTLLHYFDKKDIDKNSILIFILLSLVVLFLFMFINKKILIIPIFIIIFIFSAFIIFYNEQNFILKGYIKNPIDKKNGDNQNLNFNDLLNIPINIKKEEKKEFIKFLSFDLLKSKTKLTKIYQQDYDMEFSKIFFQNSKIPLIDNLGEFMYFISEPKYFKVIFQNDNYYIEINKILLFGRLKGEN
jgi:energy-coupling factor transporter transmembrane protein EcfT